MREPISFFVSGKPEPAGSKRAWVLKKAGQYTGRAIVTDDNKKSKPWQQTVKHAAQQAYQGEPWDCPIRLKLIFTVLRPKGHFGSGRNALVLRTGAPPYPVSKPDATKLCRGVEDALTAILWRDDAQIVTQSISKRYGGRPGVLVEIAEEAP